MKNYNKDILDWIEFPACDIIWTDPPWEERMVKWFQTKLLKETGIYRNYTLKDIITHFAYIAPTDIPVVIEYSIKGSQYIIDTMVEHGHTFINKYEATQSMNRPFLILVFNVEVPVDVTAKGRDIIINTLKRTNYNTVFDCFAGIGFTAQAVRKAGKIYIGSEIHPLRYDKLCRNNI